MRRTTSSSRTKSTAHRMLIRIYIHRSLGVDALGDFNTFAWIMSGLPLFWLTGSMYSWRSVESSVHCSALAYIHSFQIDLFQLESSSIGTRYHARTAPDLTSTVNEDSSGTVGPVSCHASRVTVMPKRFVSSRNFHNVSESTVTSRTQHLLVLLTPLYQSSVSHFQTTNLEALCLTNRLILKPLSTLYSPLYSVFPRIAYPESR